MKKGRPDGLPLYFDGEFPIWLLWQDWDER